MTDTINNTDQSHDTNRAPMETPTLEVAMTDINTEHKLTATEVNEDCPIELQDLAKRIAAHLDRARKYEEKADQNYRSVSQYLATAKATCDDAGFTAFREKFFPDMGKSRAYELLAIATNKKTIEEIKANTRERVAKHRANKANSVTVTETSNSTPLAEETPSDGGNVEDTSIAREATPEPAKPRSPVTPKDEALFGFTTAVVDLNRRIAKQKPRRFEATAVTADEVAKLGKFLTDLANLKTHGASRPTSIVARHGNGTVPAEQSAEDRKAKHAALDVSDDQAA